jgi:hypothetical protein
MDESVFGAAFRRHVLPSLRDAIFEWVIRDDVTFDEVVAEVMGLAHARGAGYLSDGYFRDLVNWIGATILDDQAFILEVRAFGSANG